MAACVILKIRASAHKCNYMRYQLTACLFILCLLFSFRSPMQFIVSGKVTDAQGSPVIAASVLEKGTQNGTSTDSKGNFHLQLRSNKAVLIISAVGYDQKEIKVNSAKPTITVTLSVSTQPLSEVVVVGYARAKRKMITGAVTSVNAKPVTDAGLLNTLQGRLPGIQISGDSKTNTYKNGNKSDSFEHANREGYDAIQENSFNKVNDHPLSTFSIDVDAASYSNIRRFINMGQLPPAGAVRIEEMINYFNYDYPQPVDEDPFSINTEIAECPWNNKHKLVLIGLQGKKISTEKLPPSNLVFLIDVSGSMSDINKLPLVKQSIKLLTAQLRPQDRVALVVYAGSAGMVLPSTSGNEKEKIMEAVERLEAGGSTAGGAGIRLAYKLAREQFIEGGNNRVILCTDGDFNVGASSDDELERMIEKERQSGVFLTVLGYGTGNYQDAKMQKLANKGNGNHAYIDGLFEARKVLVNEFGATLFTIAKDVKLQVEFNPQHVQAYRLIGYENRMLEKEDFNNDQKDAGELGSGHTVTALYEIIPAGVKSEFIKHTDKLKYQGESKTTLAASSELMTIKFRYKQPDGDKSRLIERVVLNEWRPILKASENLRFAAAVAGFGMLLRNSAYKQNASYAAMLKLARSAIGADGNGYRSEFVKMVINAKSISGGIDNKNEDEEEEDLSKR